MISHILKKLWSILKLPTSPPNIDNSSFFYVPNTSFTELTPNQSQSQPLQTQVYAPPGFIRLAGTLSWLDPDGELVPQEVSQNWIEPEGGSVNPLLSGTLGSSHGQVPSPVNPSTTFTTIQFGNDMVRKKTRRNEEEKSYNHKIIDWWLDQSYKKSGEVGLEIECEGENLFNSPLQWWSAHPDGSLRPYKGHQPIEYVLKQPVSRTDLDKALAYLAAKLKTAKSNVIESPRTSVHVHVNCQELTIKQVVTYVICYLIVEELLVEWCGPERAGNLFCLRAKDAAEFAYNLEWGIRKDDFSEVTHNEYRYSACNLAALKKFGTLEFRSMRGTVDTQLIKDWVDILLSIKQQSLTFDNPQEVLKYFDNHGVMGILRYILPNDYMRFVNVQELSRKIWDGVRLSRDIAFAIPEWEKPIEKIEKVKKTKKVRVPGLGIVDEIDINEVIDDHWATFDD